MIALELITVGNNYAHSWPDYTENYPLWLDYRLSVDNGHQIYRVGFGTRNVYGRDRCHITVWDSNRRALVEFNGSDDFEVTGDLLSELRIEVSGAVRMCAYPGDRVPDRYSGLPIVGLPTRMSGTGVHNAWAVIANVADHRTILALAALRRIERGL